MADLITTAGDRIASAGDRGRRVSQLTRERARTARVKAAMSHARVLKVAESVAAAEEQFAAALDGLADSQPDYAAHLRALGVRARERAAAERQWARAYAITSPLARDVPARASTQALAHGETGGRRALAAGAMSSLVDAYPAAVALTDSKGLIALANRRFAEMFGYLRAELIGLPVEKLIPAALRAAHRGHRAAYEQAPRMRLKDDRARLAGLRKDGTIIAVEISLSPVATDGGRYTLAVAGKAPETPGRDDIPGLVWAGATEHPHRAQELELLGRVVNNLFNAGLRLQEYRGISGQPPARHAAEILRLLDATIREIRGHVFGAHGGGTLADLPLPGTDGEAGGL